MGGALGLWVAAEWRRRWPVLLGLAAIIALAGGVPTALAAGARRADSAPARFADAVAAPNLQADINLGETGPRVEGGAVGIPLEVVDELTAIDGVDGVSVESWWAVAMYPQLDAPGIITAFAIGPSATAGRIDEPVVLAGALPQVDDGDAVIINDVAAEEMQLGVGDRMSFRTASPGRLAEWMGNDGQFDSASDLDGPVVDVEVAAVVISDDDLSEEPFPLVALTEGFARAHRDDILHVEPAVFLRVDPARLDEVRTDVAAVLAPHDVDLIEPGVVGATIRPSVNVEVMTMWLAAAVAGLAGALVVAQAAGRHVVTIAADHPVRAALGLPRSQLVAGTVISLGPAVLVGAAVVPVVGWALSGLFPRGAARLAETAPGLRWDGPALALGALVAALVAGGVVVLLAVVTGRREAPARVGRGRLAGLMLGRPALSLGASLATDPAGAGNRSRAVATATVTSIAIGVGALVTVAVVETSRHHLEATPRLYGATAEYVYQSNGTFGVAEIIERAVGTPGVTTVTRAVAINDDAVFATGPAGPASVEPSAFELVRGSARPGVFDGRYPDGLDEVALGSETARALGANVGDAIEVAIRGGAGSRRLTVTATVVSWNPDDAEHAFVVHPDTLRTVICPNAAQDDCDVSVNVFADGADDPAREALAEIGFTPVPPPGNVQRLGQVGAIPWYVAGFLALLGAVGVLHGGITSLRRRRRDLAIVRALGLTARRAAAALTWQAALTAFAGAAAGVVLGAIVGPAVWRVIADDLGVIVEPRLPVLVTAAVAVGAVVAAVLISVVPRWRAAHLSAAEGLRSE